MKNYYDILGVSPNASNDEIKQAYRLLASKLHPDKNNGNAFFDDMFKGINEAYSVLSDAVSKEKYDFKLNNLADSRRFKETEITEYDSLIVDSVVIIIVNGNASVPLLQRKLILGYNRAGRIIEQLEELGIVERFIENKSRAVLVDVNGSINILAKKVPYFSTQEFFEKLNQYKKYSSTVKKENPKPEYSYNSPSPKPKESPVDTSSVWDSVKMWRKAKNVLWVLNIILGIILFLLAKPHFTNSENNKVIETDTINKSLTAYVNPNVSKGIVKSNVGDTIYGDFNGDGNFENAFRVLTKKGYGNPVEDGVPDEYEIHFSDKRIEPIKADCCWFKLINEGDLNKDGTDEITIIQAPENGCIGSVKTFTIKDKKGYLLIDPFSLFWCANITDAELQKLIVRENGTIYYYEADPNDEYLLNDKGDKIRFERLRKNKATIIGTLSDQSSDVLSDLPPAIEEITDSDNSRQDNEAGYIDNDIYTDYSDKDVEVHDNTVYNTAGLQIRPEYPGGIDKLYEYVQLNFKKPEVDRDTSLKITVSFVVEKDGSLTDIKVLNDPGYDAGKEVQRILKSVTTKWKPGKQNGKPVRAKYILSVVIKVQGN